MLLRPQPSFITMYNMRKLEGYGTSVIFYFRLFDMSIVFLFSGLRADTHMHTHTDTDTHTHRHTHTDTYTHNDFMDKSNLKKPGAHEPSAGKHLV